MNNTDYQNMVRDILQKGLQADMEARGFSMFPTFTPRFVHRLQQCNPSTLKRGDLVVFERNDKHWVAHRVICNTGNYIITRGDSVLQDDGKIEYSSIIAQIISTSVFGIKFNLQWWLPRIYGHMLLACHPISTGVNHAFAWLICKCINGSKKIYRWIKK